MSCWGQCFDMLPSNSQLKDEHDVLTCTSSHWLLLSNRYKWQAHSPPCLHNFCSLVAARLGRYEALVREHLGGLSMVKLAILRSRVRKFHYEFQTTLWMESSTNYSCCIDAFYWHHLLQFCTKTLIVEWFDNIYVWQESFLQYPEICCFYVTYATNNQYD